MTQSKVPGPNLGSVTITGTVTEKQDQPAATAATWTSATALNTAVTVATTGYGTANVFIVVPTTTTAGVITIEVSNDGGTTYVPGGAVRVDNGEQLSAVPLAFAPGINGSRMYAVSVDAMTQVRARLSTVIVGAGNVVVTVSTVANGIEPFVAQRSRKVATYSAAYRTTTRIYNLSFAIVANTRKQFATIHHAATATRTVRIRRAWIAVRDVSAAGGFAFDFVRITTAPATGNPAITPTVGDSSDAAAEATCLALPTTAGTESAVVWNTEYANWGITGAGPTAVPQPVFPKIYLVGGPGLNADHEAKAPTIRAGILEGWAITVDSNSASTMNAWCGIEFTEEAP